MDILSLVQQVLGLAGLGAFLSFLVNALKVFGVIKDGQAPEWLTGLNLIALNLLFVAKVVGGVNIQGVDSFLAIVAQVGGIVIAFFIQRAGAKVAYKLTRGAPLLGFSHTLRLAGKM